MRLSRRTFLKVGACLAGGLLVEFSAGPAQAARPNAFIAIGVDGGVRLCVPSTEVGQGVHATYALLVASELDVEPADIQVEMAPCAPEYFNLLAGEMFTGDSSSVRAFLAPLSSAAATARLLLLQAAANRWGVNPRECTTAKGRVHCGIRSLAYGTLAAQAAALSLTPSPSPKVELTPPAALSTLVGADRTHALARVRGEAVFGMDIRLEGMVFASPLHCPVYGGRLRSLDTSAVDRMPGVVAVLEASDRVVAVAQSSYGALKALRALEPQWEVPDPVDLQDALAAALEEGPGFSAAGHGSDSSLAVQESAREVTLEFRAPLLAHAAMEPVSATVRIDGDQVEVWAPTQVQSRARRAVSEVLRVPESKVAIHTTLAGGSFGRKLEVDYIVEAAETAREVARPVQFFWSREQEMRHDFFRPAALARVTVGLDAHGIPVRWTQRLATPSVGERYHPKAYAGELDPFAVEGALEMPYRLADYGCSWHPAEIGIPVGHWRSVGHSLNAWFREHAFDAAVLGSGHHPLELRLRLLNDHPRLSDVLQTVRRLAGPTPPGSFRGAAVHACYGSFVAHMVELSLQGDRPRVDRIWCALDCGRVVDPDTVRAQAEGGTLFALSATLREQVVPSDKGPGPTNFDGYRLLTLAETPTLEVHLVDSQAPPGGVGEACVPTLAPALCNGVLAATGKPVSRLPLYG